MPRLSDTAVPAYRRHKGSNQAVVWIPGHGDIYLGPWRSSESKEKYGRITAEWLAGGRQLPADPQSITVAEIVVRFRKYASAYYADADGNPTGEAENFEHAVRPLLKLYGRTPASEFGPLRLRTVREAMITSGLCRNSVNARVNKVRYVFKWAAENELIHPSVYHGLTALSGLRRGRSEAIESEPVKPISPEHDIAKRDVFKTFKNEVLSNFTSYQVPVITLNHDTSHEAVCLVFEKVNTGGKPLDAFELLTALYAARGHKLRDDWLGADGKKGMQTRLAEFGRAADQTVGVLGKVASTDVLQAIALGHTKKVRADKVAAGVSENDLPAVRATRQSLLDLPLEAYLEYRDRVEAGFKKAAKFLRQQHVHRVIDLPYQTQLVPLAAILSEIGEKAEHAGHMAKISRWFWCGIFGELYGGAIESRFAKDVVEVPAWLDGGPEPSTVSGGLDRS